MEHPLIKILQPGMLLTHTRCMGVIEEHVFREMDGIWIVGDETADTQKLAGRGKGIFHDAWTNDIHPNSVTHINRIPVDQFTFAASKHQNFRYNRNPF